MTAHELVTYNTSKAFVVYLSQPDASPAVCDTSTKGPHMSEFNKDFQDALVTGFVKGKIPPALWVRCIKRVLRGLPEESAALLHDRLARELRKMLRSSEIEKDSQMGERLSTLQLLYLERRRDQNAHPKVVAPMFDELRKALEGKAMGPVARAMGGDLLTIVEIENGRWQGQEISITTIDELAAAGDETNLWRIAKRHPSPELRIEASRRIIRIHIALSSFSEVQAAATDVEDRVLAEGNNRVSLVDFPLVRAWLVDSKAPKRNVRIRQDVWNQRAKLLGYSADTKKLSVLPDLSFGEILWAELQSVSRPVTVCENRKSLNPLPCIHISDISLDNPFTYLEGKRLFRFRDNLGVAKVVPLAANDDFMLPLRIGGVPATALRWGLFFEQPENLIFKGRAPGGDGPNLVVHIERPHHARFVFYVTAPSGTYIAILQTGDLGRYGVATIGAQGFAGAPGFSGTPGTDGGACQDGGNGGDGGAGYNGGPGGDGGDVLVRIFCGQYNCEETVNMLSGVVWSQGGAGGPGGEGGSGGRGGHGGSAQSNSTYTDSNGNQHENNDGCSAGSDGSPGWNGADGYDGRDGSPGRVTIEVVR
ncbi:MAG: hypothetical protein FWD46_01650 [Cystobacterineae bacterium]|nr:hypothetical protein [Cystobacterineae bacterium]